MINRICKIVFLCGISLILHAGDLRKDFWECTDLIWNAGIVFQCDKGVVSSPVKFFENEYSVSFNKDAYKDIRSGDTVWIRCFFVREFCEQVLPEIKRPFVLVISVGDESFPSDCNLTSDQLERFLGDRKIIHIFAQNCDFRGVHPKITPIPIGIDFHTIGYKGAQGGWGEKGSPLVQEAQLRRIAQTFPPTYLRKKKAFVDFQHSDSSRYGEHKRYLQLGEDRTTIFNYFRSTRLVDYGNWMRRSELWKTKGQYAFSISPHGNGLDCHRTWEDLALGCIVIVKTSPLDPLYEGLPVVIVRDWAEVTLENMEKWLELFGDASTNPAYRERLTLNYWMDKIQAAALPYKRLSP